ncbi:hypothetical protein [Lacticaseibacillus zeae]|uniref:hypothetical protein n=1 Tax=Lacticaseibacillus zeae TaxID=57037 RepID=UPI001E478A0D|nr:hypothetical protein [Lacticaseibacillus zeae]
MVIVKKIPEAFVLHLLMSLAKVSGILMSFMCGGIEWRVGNFALIIPIRLSV